MSLHTTFVEMAVASPLASQLQNIVDADLITLGESEAQVYRLVDASGVHSFLKVCSRNAAYPLADDVARLRWLAGRLPVPAVLAYAESESQGYLLMSAVAGVDTATLAVTDGMEMAELKWALFENGSPGKEGNYRFQANRAIVRLLAEALRQFHAVPIADCPFDHRLPSELARVKSRTVRGQVAEEDFDAARYGRTAESLLAELLAAAETIDTPDHDIVLTHGDYCLPNILLAGGQVSGFIDLGRMGVGDRYRDLALARRSLIRNCGAEWVDYFFACYGLPNPDQAKLDFYQLLDEFY